MQSVEHYLEQHPEIAFLFYKDYDSRQPTDLAQILSKDGVFKPAEPSSESLSLTSEHIISAVEILADQLPGSFDLFPDIDFDREIKAPYLFVYYSIPLLHLVQPHLSPLQNNFQIDQQYPSQSWNGIRRSQTPCLERSSHEKAYEILGTTGRRTCEE